MKHSIVAILVTRQNILNECACQYVDQSTLNGDLHGRIYNMHIQFKIETVFFFVLNERILRLCTKVGFDLNLKLPPAQCSRARSEPQCGQPEDDGPVNLDSIQIFWIRDGGCQRLRLHHPTNGPVQQ